MGIYLSIT